MTRVCNRCNNEKDLELFTKNRSKSLGYDSLCKECRSSERKSKEYRIKERSRINSNPELKTKRNSYTYDWKKNNKDKVKKTQKNWFLKNLYGITLDQYNTIFTSQEGKCAICEIHQSELSKSLAVDHDHETGKIRNLLCADCNTALGLAKENPDLLIKMSEYIKLHKE